MGTLQPFNTVIEQQELTQAEFLRLKNQLAELRKEFAQKTGVHHPKIDLKKLQNIEQKMYSTEHRLAHASIIYTQPEERPYHGTFRSVLTEIRLNLMGVWMTIRQKVRPQKHAYTHHTTTYHLKR